jgi:hypothetical protein
MRYLILLVFLFGSCSMAESVRKVADQASEVLAEARQTYEEARAAADVDQSGDVSVEEWLGYLAGLVGLGGGGLLARNAKSNARKTILESQVEEMSKKLPS